MNTNGEKRESVQMNEWMKALLRSIPDLILFKDGAGRWIFASQYTLTLFGLEDQDYIGKTSAELAQMTPVTAYRDILLARAKAEEEAWKLQDNTRGEVAFPALDGRSVILDVIICPIFGPEGNREALVVIGRDITDRKLAEERAAQLAYYDQLTRLPNRLRFEQELEYRILIANTLQQRFAVLFLDIDRFQYINNALGPAIGDQLILLIAERLRRFVPKDGFLAHMGRDKFAVLIPNVFGMDKCIDIAENMIEGAGEPFLVGKYELFITATIGICSYPDDGEDAQTLLKHADVALSLAKEKGKNRYLVFNSKMDIATFKIFSIENSLNKAMLNDQFEVYYQPKVEVGTNRIVGAEALIRWNHPEWDLVSPKEFVPIAEETGLIIPIGEWMLQTVCNQNKVWQQDGIPIVPISVNSSVKQFLQRDFIERIECILDEAGLESRYLEVEITETSLIENETFVMEVIDQLRRLGIRVSLDDFGTGYSVLSYLKQFVVDTIKIDRSFIKEIETNEKVARIVKGIIQLVKSLDMKVVAEGVETKEQLQFLHRHQVDQIQGYLYSRPVTAKEFERLLRKGYLECSETSPTLQFANRRKQGRTQLTYPLRGEMTIIKFMGKDIALGKSEVLIWDVGPGGLSFSSDIRLPVRPDLILSVQAAMMEQTADFVGRIVRIKEWDEETYRYGMEFLLEEGERESFADVLNLFAGLRQESS